MSRLKSSLRNRLTAILLLVSLIPLIIVALVSYIQARRSIEDAFIREITLFNQAAANDLQASLTQFKTDLLGVAQTPPVQAIIRARANGGMDPQSNDSYETWVNRLDQIFILLAESKQFYPQLRYLDENGRELAGVNFDGQQARVVPPEQLVDHSHQAYFQETLKQQVGDIYISDITLYQDGDVVNQPVLHLGIPIFDANGRVQAALISTVAANHFLDRLDSDIGQVHLVDQNGFYLKHPDPTREFGWQTDSDANAQDDFAWAFAQLGEADHFVARDATAAQVVAIERVPFDPLHPDRYWLVLKSLPEETFLADINALGTVISALVAAVVLIIVIVAVWTARAITNPIRLLATASEQIAQGEWDTPLPINTGDEIGQLARSFQRMAVQLHRLIDDLRASKETAESANRAKSLFLANMSHELRTPLNAILGFTQLIRRDVDLSQNQLDRLQIINRSGEHLLDLINDVLEMSKIEAGRITLNEQPFDLHRLLQDLEDLFSFRADKKELNLLFERAPQVPRFVTTDESKLRQVLINLLGNAIKFTDTGYVAVRIDYRQADPRAYLLFAIEDTGIGIATEEQDRVFDAFVQTSNGQFRQEGTGLGLPISQQFVQMMGGKIRVTSEPGVGTVFQFEIAVQTADATDLETSSLNRRILGLKPDQPPHRILIVEDQLENRQLLVHLLQPLGFEMREASDGQEGIEVWRTWRPHLILMDIRMPVMDGLAATQYIKEMPAGRETAVIALTASAFEEDRAMILAAGSDDFVRKPFREQELLNTIARHLGIEYVYEKGDKVKTAETPLTVSDMTAIPLHLLDGLHQATIQADIDLMGHYIKQIGKVAPHIGQLLTECTNKFDYDQIIALTEPMSDNGSTQNSLITNQ